MWAMVVDFRRGDGIGQDISAAMKLLLAIGRGERGTWPEFGGKIRAETAPEQRDFRKATHTFAKIKSGHRDTFFRTHTLELPDSAML
jgi:hypothetical protein